jgi:hypothetical protein
MSKGTVFRPTSYLLRFGTPRRHTEAWASPPPQPVASLPHHHHCWLSASRWSAGRFLERFSSVSRAFLRVFFLAVFGHVSSDFFCSSTAFGASEPTLHGSYRLIAIAHDYKLHVVGGVLTRWVSQAMGYSRSMFLKICLAMDPFFCCSRRDCTPAGHKGYKMAQAH